MTGDLLRDVGGALYGPRWRADMARALDVAERTIYRWEAGTSPIPPGVWGELLKLVNERQGELGDLAERLELVID